MRPLERIALLEMEHDSLSVPEISQSCKSMKLLLRLGENVEEQEEEGLENDLGESLSTKLVWKPTTTTELDLEGMEKLMRLIDALEDDDDVQRVTTNFEASDEVMAQLEGSD